LTDWKKMRNYTIASLLIVTALAGCNRLPGVLEGTWKADGLVPMTITFRPGETEAMGVIERVDYAVNGNVVKVTYKDGMMKGSAIAFTIVNRNLVTTPMYTLRRIQ
jgi:hypothetical protein